MMIRVGAHTTITCIGVHLRIRGRVEEEEGTAAIVRTIVKNDSSKIITMSQH